MSKPLVSTTLLALLAACSTQAPAPVTPPESPADPTVVVSGLTTPTGVRAMPGSDLLVVELGTGGTTELPMAPAPDGTPQTALLGDTARILSVSPETGEKRELVKLPSISAGPVTLGANRVMSHRGTLYVSVGGWSSEVDAERPALSGSVARIDGDTATPLATTWDIEERDNPDGAARETNPFGLASAPDGSFWITDAAANTLLRLEPETGEVSLVATFPYLAPGVQAVPTGLSMVVDVRVAPDGGVYAVQLGEMGEEGPLPESGAILRLRKGRAEVVVAGLDGPSALSFGEGGDAYISLLGNGPALGSVVKVAGLSAPGSSIPVSTGGANP